MPSYVMPAASMLMIVGSLATLWLFRRHEHARYYMLVYSGVAITGAAWFLPSESAHALLAVTGAACSLVGVVLLMLTILRGPARKA
jgi:hypothetical protein